MKSCSPELSSGELWVSDARWKWIIHFWNELHTCGNPGATTWEVLESLEKEVMECLYRRSPPDIEGAASITAKAGHLIAGFIDL